MVNTVAQDATERIEQQQKTNEAITIDVEEQERQRKIADDAERQRKAGNRLVLIINGVEYPFRWCPANRFMMGSPVSESGRSENETQRQTTLTRGFWMLETEVTQEMWVGIMESNPSHFKGNKKLPVENVSWNDCQEYVKKLNALGVAPAGYRFSLPTETQWEHACRAGTTTQLNNGKNLTSEYGACQNLDEVGWYKRNSGGQTQEVGRKKPNAWGLYDMHGNVGEWCLDLHVRGGSWYDSPPFCQSWGLGSSYPTNRNSSLGLRLCLVREN